MATERWLASGPTGFAITLGLTLLNFQYAELAIFGALHWRENPGIALIVAFIVIRTAFLTQMQTCEPRYVLECIPALLALGAQSWRSRSSKLAYALTPTIPAVRLSTILPYRVRQGVQ